MALTPERTRYDRLSVDCFASRDNPVIVDFYREVGYLPDAIINYLLLLGWSLDDKTEDFSRDEMIKSRGEKVSPKEVENVIYELAGVREVAVIGVPDPILGQAIKAIVVAEDGITGRDIIRHCAARLEEFMVPSLVEFRGELPKSENGKIVRKELIAA